MPYINERWLGGMLTNFETIAKRVQKMQEYQRMRAAGDFEAMPKKEALLIGRELEKLERNLKGIREMTKLPEAVFILDTKKEHIGVTEANKLGIPIVAVVDTNCDPDLIQYVIPGNDDAIRAGTLMCRIIADAVEEGRLIASKRGGGPRRPAAARTAEDDARIATQQAEARRQAALQAQEREARLAATLGRARARPEPSPEARPEAAAAPEPEPAVAAEAAPAEEAAGTAPKLVAQRPKPPPRSRNSNGRVRRKGCEGAARRDRRRDDGREARPARERRRHGEGRRSGCASRASRSPPAGPTARTLKAQSRLRRKQTWPRSSS